MSADFMSKATADQQFEQGDDCAESETPVCEGCDCDAVTVRDYYQGQLKTPLWLCADCTDAQRDHDYERSSAAYYGGAR